MLSLALACALLPSAPKQIDVGVLLDGDSPRDASYLALFKEEMVALTKGDFELRFPEDKQISGDWTLESVRAGFTKLQGDQDVDLVMAMGLIAGQIAGTTDPLAKPVLAPFVIDPKIQGIPFTQGKSGRKNLSYIASPQVFVNDLRAFAELVEFKKAAVLVTAGFRGAVPALDQRSDAIAKELGVELVPIEVGPSGAETIRNLPQDIDAIYLGVLLRLEPGQLEEMVQAMIDRKLPSFSMVGRTEVEAGVLAGVSAGLDVERIARRAALNVQRILLGEDAGTLRVSMARKERLTINMATARAINFSPTWTVLTRAEVIRTSRERVGREVTLQAAAKAALDANLDLLANKKEVEAGAAEVKKARAGLLPSLDLTVNAAQIDKDRAAASFGNTAERQITLGGRLSQVLFADGAWANFTINEHLQSSRVYQREALTLDVVQESADAYLNLLRAKVFERIQRDNLDLTRSNKELAEIRVSVGAASRAEIYRWEAELAQSRSRVIEASANRNAAEIGLNRVMNRPLEEGFVTADDLDEPAALAPAKALFGMLQTPKAFRRYRTFMAQQGIDASPELRAIDQGIAATDRGLTSTQRSFFIPDFVLQGSLDQILLQDGAGSESVELPAGLAGAIPATDSTTWSVVLGASIPLFSGGERYADLQRVRSQLSQQQMERQSVAQRIEQRIRTTIHIAGASYANIALARQASRAAKKNLEVVRDAYARGALTYLNLLDAQNAALVADQVAANAVYDFLSDQIAVQRAVSGFTFLMPNDEYQAWINGLSRFITEGEPQ